MLSVACAYVRVFAKSVLQIRLHLKHELWSNRKFDDTQT